MNPNAIPLVLILIATALFGVVYRHRLAASTKRHLGRSAGPQTRDAVDIYAFFGGLGLLVLAMVLLFG